jgi:G3E family GTPase
MDGNIIAENRIPVTIITGFLGAGKTTLLNNLIKKYSNKQFAIIENEFGSIGIDGGLIVGVDDNIFELNNGCICCSLNDDFYLTVKKLLDSKQKFNHLLLETTGIANPDTIITTFFTYKEFVTAFEIDSVICVADAENMEDIMELQPEIVKQLAVADIVLINKIDAVHPNYIEQLKQKIGGINHSNLIYTVKHSDISNIDILDTFAFSPEVIEKTTHKFLRLKTGTNQFPTQSFIQKPIKNKFKHDIVSIGIEMEGSLSYEKFSLWIQRFMSINDSLIFRIKGIISFDNMPEKFIFQAVRTTYLIDNNDEWESERRFTKLIFIGKDIENMGIEESLKELLTTQN